MALPAIAATMRVMLPLLAVLALGLTLAIGASVWLMIWRLRHPPRRTYAWAMARSVPGDPSELDTPREFVATELAVGEGIRCPAWDIRGDDPQGPVIIATPGWGDSKIGALFRIDALCAHASRLIAWDPPGTGEARGLCPMGTREPAMVLAIARWLRAEESAPAVIAHGWSLGGGVAIAAAGLDAERGTCLLDGAIAECPYRVPWTPAFRVMRGAGLPWRINGPIAMALLGLRLTRHPRWRGFDRVRWAARVRVPVLVIHGARDTVCPPEDGRAIAGASASHGDFIEVPGAAHNDLWTDDRWRNAVADAVRTHVRAVASRTRRPPA